MKIVKNILLIILGIIVIFLAIGLFLDKDYAVEREIVISSPKNEVFDYIKYLKNQDNYSVWQKNDPHMVKSYRGQDGTVGFVARWESDSANVGVGEQEIIKIEEGKRIDFELRFYEPFESIEPAYMELESLDGDRTLVKWGFNGHFDYPMNLMLLFMDMEEMVGNDLETGLKYLKEELE
ncbi:hypothetical protein GCM10027429_25100 [Marivirga atlantica]|jgi:hypothetical protein|uniref:SRPBCC family protein n=1 Tax=Marivirga atlantica TaxID=1548457 RepID=A0A937AC49_9BACT|nr:SRPBCC family protein [Marivirga atlantica]MBL0766110.1 SRPBCC family protein [Marivirga atlantica]